MAEMQIINVSFWEVMRLTVSNLVIAAIIFAFLNKMYQRKYSESKKYVFAYIISVITFILVSCVGIPIINAIYSLLFINLIAFMLYKIDSKMCVLYNSCYALMAIFSEIISASLLSTLSGNTISETIGNYASMCVSSIVGWIAQLLSYKILITLFKKEERTDVKVKEQIFFTFITALEISITGYFLSIIEGTSSGMVLTVFLACFFIVDVYITYLIREAARSSALKYELELSQQQVSMQHKHYKDVLIKQEKAQSIIHDTKKHILTVEGLYLNDSNVKAGEYTAQLFNKLDSLTFDFKCSNQILGIIISSKLQEAEGMQIRINPVIADVSIDFISDLDVTTIFANLLDNSFEECSNLPTELRKVSFSLKKKNQFIVIDIRNPVKSVPKPINNVFKTDKKGHSGIGLSNVISAVEKYNGNFIAEVEKGHFIVSITIPIK